MKSSIHKRPVVVDGRKTSISVENLFWFGLNENAIDRGMHVSELAGELKAKPVRGRCFTSTVKTYGFSYFKDRLQAVAGIVREIAPRATTTPVRTR